jgi:hypothetical protein
MNELELANYLFSLDLHTKSYASEYGCLYIVAANSIAEAQELAAKHYIGDHRSPETRKDIDFGECRPIGVPMPGATPGVVSSFVT